MNKIYLFYSFAIISTVFILTSLSAYAEVIELQTDSKSYLKGDNITFLGNVENGDSGIVTIVIRDSNDDFVLLTQAKTDHNHFFKKTIQLNEKFTTYGTYKAIGFILNMTAGHDTQFNITNNEMSLSLIETPNSIPKDSKSIPNHETLETTASEKKTMPYPNFIDEDKDPRYYLERYYNEPEYKAWFDRNYPDYTIEEVVGYNDYDYFQTPQATQKEIFPNAQAISTSSINETNSDNGELAQVVLAILALGILFGATYGIKKKVDDNSKQISINTNTIRNKIIKPIIGSNPLDVLQMRLAKGEITVKEYCHLKRELKR